MEHYLSTLQTGRILPLITVSFRYIRMYEITQMRQFNSGLRLGDSKWNHQAEWLQLSK